MRFRAGLGMALAILTLASPAHASSSATLPIDVTLNKIVQWMSGGVATALGTIALVAAAFVWMFLRHERGADFAVRALVGTALAIGAGAVVSYFVSGGALL
jgi:type IV secretory pathway VirB2 component (pilin)